MAKVETEQLYTCDREAVNKNGEVKLNWYNHGAINFWYKRSQTFIIRPTTSNAPHTLKTTNPSKWNPQTAKSSCDITFQERFPLHPVGDFSLLALRRR